MFWDFMTLRPETLHALLMYFSDRGTPDGYRHMHGYGAHAYRFVNPSGDTFYVKFHFKTDQGIKNLDSRRCTELISHDPDYSIRDLYNSIKKGNYPSWSMFIQVMLNEEAKKCKFNPFDVTKVWPQRNIHWYQLENWYSIAIQPIILQKSNSWPLVRHILYPALNPRRIKCFRVDSLPTETRNVIDWAQTICRYLSIVHIVCR